MEKDKIATTCVDYDYEQILYTGILINFAPVYVCKQNIQNNYVKNCEHFERL